MPSQRLLRFGGAALVVIAVLQLLCTIFDPDLTADPRAIQHPAWIPTHLGFAVVYTLVLPGLVAMYLRQAHSLGWLGETGFVLAMFGSVLTVAISTLVGISLPLLAPQFPDLARSLDYFEPGRPLHSMQPAVALTALTYFPGFVITGIVTARAGVFSRWAGVLLALGALGTLGALAGPGFTGRAITIAGSCCLAAAFTRFGWQLMAE